MTRSNTDIARAALFALAIAASTGALTCGEDSDGESQAPINDATPARTSLLTHLGEDVILQTYKDFEASTVELEAACEALANSTSSSDREAAQDAWKATVALWQQAEVFQIGPAGLQETVAGGQGIRDEIYSWPLVNTCRIDQETVEAAFEDVDAFAAEPINVRGFDAMEYLLFVESADNTCAPNSAINRDGTWDALEDADVEQRRATYALTLSKLIAAQATRLRTAWDPEGGNFVAQLAGAGINSETYLSSQEALNALTDAMFYVEKEVKDMKLAIPAGLTDCAEATCPDALESPFANHSKEHLLANTRALRKMFVAEGDGTAFSDLLIDVGAEQLAADLTRELDEAIAAIEAIDGSLQDALAADPQSVVAAHTALQEAMTLLKTQFLSVLDLELPDRAEGDND